jgi:hypothetical protein
MVRQSSRSSTTLPSSGPVERRLLQASRDTQEWPRCEDRINLDPEPRIQFSRDRDVREVEISHDVGGAREAGPSGERG